MYIQAEQAEEKLAQTQSAIELMNSKFEEQASRPPPLMLFTLFYSHCFVHIVLFALLLTLLVAKTRWQVNAAVQEALAAQ